MLKGEDRQMYRAYGMKSDSVSTLTVKCYELM